MCFTRGSQTERYDNRTTCMETNRHLSIECIGFLSEKEAPPFEVLLFSGTDVAALCTLTPDICTYAQCVVKQRPNRCPSPFAPSAFQHAVGWRAARERCISFCGGGGSDVHWIKNVVLVNYQGYLVQIKLGESHVWVVGFSLQWCPAWTFVL